MSTKRISTTCSPTYRKTTINNSCDVHSCIICIFTTNTHKSITFNIKKIELNKVEILLKKGCKGAHSTSVSCATHAPYVVGPTK